MTTTRWRLTLTFHSLMVVASLIVVADGLGLNSWKSSQQHRFCACHNSNIFCRNSKWKNRWSPHCPSSSSSSFLCMSDSSSSSNNENPGPSPSVRQAWERQRDEAKGVLERLDSLEERIQAGGGTEDVSEEVKAQVLAIQKEVDKWDKTIEGVILPDGISIENVGRMAGILWRLPFSVRLTILDAYGFDTKLVADPSTYPAVVGKMLDYNPTPLQWELARDRTKESVNKLEQRLLGGISSGEALEEDATGGEVSTGESAVMKWIDTLEKASRIVDKNADFTDSRNAVKYRRNGWYGCLPRALLTSKRKLDQKQLETVQKAFAKDVFVPTSAPEEICASGGYLIEGRTTKKTGAELIASLDKKLDEAFEKADVARPSVCYVEYPVKSLLTDKNIDEEDPVDLFNQMEAPPALLVFDKDMSPLTSPLIKIGANVVSLATAFFFCYDAYARNLGDEFLSQTPTETVASLFLAILGPLFFIQFLHEAAHLLVAKTNGFKTTIPTLIPFAAYLPFFGCKTELKESAKNRTVLFDFAYVGPLIGIISSLIILLLGIQNTLLASPQEVSETFPAIPVSWIRLSTLTGTIMDILFGGPGMVTGNGNGQIALHPFAIAGFCGLLSQSLELLPIGNSDGGRLILTLFGRDNSRLVIAVSWLAIIVGSLFAANDSFDLLLGSLIVFQITNQDPEVPCRNEVDPVGPFRALAALGLFFIGILVAFPMDPFSGDGTMDGTIGMM